MTSAQRKDVSFSRWREKVPEADEGGASESMSPAHAPPSPDALRASTSPASGRDELAEHKDLLT